MLEEADKKNEFNSSGETGKTGEGEDLQRESLQRSCHFDMPSGAEERAS